MSPHLFAMLDEGRTDVMAGSSAAGPGTAHRSITVTSYRPVEELELQPAPIPPVGPDDVLVRVMAAAISPGVRALITGVPYASRLAGNGLRRPRHPVPGFDVAGLVGAIGDNVTRLAVGDPVFGNADGSLADFAVAPADLLAPLPAEWSFEEAAAVPESGCVALQAVRDRAAVGPGDRVAVIGAGGGVGTYLTHLAIARGALVTAVCSATMAPHVAALGVGEVVDYRTRELVDLDHRFDVIFDTAGRTPLRRVLPALERNGRLVIIGADHRRRLTGGLGRWLRAKAVSMFTPRRLEPFVAAPLDRVLLDDLVEAMEAGALRPAVDRVFPLDEAAAAFRYLDHRTRPGKVVLRPSTEERETR